MLGQTAEDSSEKRKSTRAAKKVKKDPLRRLDSTLEELPLADEQAQDLECRFLAQLAEYTSQYAGFEAESKLVGKDPSSVVKTPQPEGVAGMFSMWRQCYIDKVTNLDSRLPQQHVCAERMRKEVEQALKQTNDAESTRQYLHDHFLRRVGTLRCQVAMHVGRLRSCVGGAEQPNGTLWRSMVDASCSLHNKEIVTIERRIQNLRSTTPDAASSLYDVKWSGPIQSIIRQLLSQDQATKTLQHFLLRLQYLGFSNRSRLWRRALELRAVAELPAAGETADSVSKSGRVPVGVKARKPLEQALEELGSIFKCGVSLQMDRGRAFAHQVAIDFAQIFDKQQRRMEFKIYPLAAHGAIAGALAGNVGSASQLGEATGESRRDVAPVVLRDENNADSWYLRPDSWATDAAWEASIDPATSERGVLLKASFAAAHTPMRMHHGEPSYARELLENVVNTVKPQDGTGSWTGDMDSILNAEKAFLEVGDVKVVMRRLNEFAGRHRTQEDVQDASAAHDGLPDEKLPQPLVRAYYMLRHLQCRALRWRLLHILNFFRFVQRRLIAGMDEERMGKTPSGNNRTGGTSRPTKERLNSSGQQLQWDLSARTLTEMYHQCTLPTMTSLGQSSDGEEGQLDRESLQRSDEDDLLVISEAGLRVMHQAAAHDLAGLERELMSTGSYYIHKFESTGRSGELERVAADRVGVLLDLYTCEVGLNLEKRNLLEIYVEIYEHTTDLLEKRDLAQRMINVMASRPLLDLNDGYFTDAYAVSICVLQSRTSLLRQLVKHQVQTERKLARASPELAKTPVVQSKPAAVAQDGLPSALGEMDDDELAELRQKRRSSVTRLSSSEPSEAGDADEDDDIMPPKWTLAHSMEGYRFSSSMDAPHVLLTPSAEPVAIDEFCSSLSLVWRAELLIEEIHKDLAEHLRPPSELLSGLLERSCYTFALELWNEEETRFHKPPGGLHEDPELLLLIIKETTLRVTGAAGGKTKSEDETPSATPLQALGGLEIEGFLHLGYSELRRRCGNNHLEMLMHCMINLLEHVRLRHKISDTAVEVSCLEKVLQSQAVAFGSRIDCVRLPPLFEGQGENASGYADKKSGNTWIDTPGPILSAGMLDADMGYVDLSTPRSLALQCTPVRLQEMRHLYQHELAYRNLLLTCVQHNALLLDPTMRQKEMADVALVGPSRDVLASDLGVEVMRKLRQTAGLSGSRGGERANGSQRESSRELQQAKAKGADTQIFMDVSRYSNLMQTPSVNVSSLRAAAAQLWRMRADSLRSVDQGVSERERQMRLLWYCLLGCTSLLTVRCACDLSVRVQAAHAASAFRSVAMLIPQRLSPFDRFNDKKRQLIERDGTVGSVFTIPTTLEVLQLRGILADQDLLSTMSEIMNVLMPVRASSSIPAHSSAHMRRPSRKFSLWGSLTSHRERETEHHHVEEVINPLSRPEALQLLEIDYDGPAFTTLLVLQELTCLLILHYSLVTIDGDPLTLLRMQHLVRSSTLDVDASQDIVGSTLSRTEPTFEALEELRTALSQLARRLDALGDGARDPESVYKVLRTEVRAAYRQLMLLLRQSARACLQDGELEDYAQIRHWSFFLDGFKSGLPCSTIPSISTGRHVPLASLPMFGPMIVKDSDTEFKPTFGRATSLSASIARVKSEPEVLTLSRDATRYITELHPELYPKHPVLNPFMRALLADLVPEDLSREGQLPDEDVLWLPFHSPVPWKQPRSTLLPLISALCSLPKSRRHQMSASRLRLHDRRAVFHELHSCDRHSDRSVNADAELFGTELLRDILREHVVSGQLAASPPMSKETLEQFDAHWQAHFSFPQENSSKDAEGASDTEEKDDFTENLLTKPGAKPADIRQMQTESNAAYREISALVTALDRLLLAVGCERLGNELTILAEHRHSASAASSALLNPAAAARLNARGGSLYAAKVDTILHALNQLRDHSSYVQMHGVGSEDSDERAYVFREKDLNECVEYLLRSMTMWGDSVVQSREKLLNELITYLNFRREGLMQEMHRVKGERPMVTDDAAAALARDSRAKGEVADRGCKLVFEVDRLHRVIRDLKTVSREIEYRLSSEIWNKVREAVGALTSKLLGEIGRYRESHGQNASRIALKFREIRDDISYQLAEVAAENYQAQQRALQPRLRFRQGEQSPAEDDEWPSVEGSRSRTEEDPLADTKLLISDGMHHKYRQVARRDDRRLLQIEVWELKNRQILTRAFHYFKVQATRQRFEEKMQALRMTLSSNKELWERLGTASASAANTDLEFASTAQAMSLAELRIEQLRAQVESNTEHRQKLQTWKKSKARQVKHLEQKVRSHHRLGALNVEGLLKELREKEDLVQALREARQAEDEAVEKKTKECRRKTEKLRTQLEDLRKLKQAARSDLDNARREIENNTFTGEDRLNLWRKRVQEVKRRLMAAERENQELIAQGLNAEDEEEEESDSFEEEW